MSLENLPLAGELQLVLPVFTPLCLSTSHSKVLSSNVPTGDQIFPALTGYWTIPHFSPSTHIGAILFYFFTLL